MLPEVSVVSHYAGKAGTMKYEQEIMRAVNAGITQEVVGQIIHEVRMACASLIHVGTSPGKERI